MRTSEPRVARGHELMASYALYARAFEELRLEVRWLALGGSAGPIEGDATDGLSRFKAGWATGTRQTYLCGRVLQPDTYRALSDGASGRGLLPGLSLRRVCAR